MQRALVIGSGGIGLSSAYYLTQSGWHVTVLDQGEIGRGCSYGNACLIVPSHSHPLPAPGVIGQALRWMFNRDSPFYIKPRLNPDLARWLWRFTRYCNAADAERGHQASLTLNRASLELFDTLAQSHDVDFFFRRDGLLHVYVTKMAAARRPQELEMLQAGGFSARRLSRDETLLLEPSLSDRIFGGLFIEGEAHAFSYGFSLALADWLGKNGATFITQRPVRRIVVERGQARGIEMGIPAETLDADLVVLAAGAWSPELAAGVGVRIPLQPAKGYSCTIDAYDGSPQIPILIPERRVILTPLGSRLRFGGTLELTGYDLDLNRRRYQTLIRGAHSVLREPPEMKNEEAWCGLRPLTPDGLPIIDRVPGIEGLIVATGHAMMGFTQAPITGKLVAELACRQPPSIPLEPFRLTRF